MKAAVTNGAVLKDLSGTGSVSLGSKTLTLTTPGSTFAGVIGGSGGLSVTATARFMKQGYVYLGLDTEVRAGKTEDIGITAGVRAMF